MANRENPVYPSPWNKWFPYEPIPSTPQIAPYRVHLLVSLRSLRLPASDLLASALRVGCLVAAIELHSLGRRPCDCVLRLGGRCDCDW
eukprot:14004491-Alexandrium_andersonii.AAC.1